MWHFFNLPQNYAKLPAHTLAPKKLRSWSLPAALIDGDLQVYRYVLLDKNREGTLTDEEDRELDSFLNVGRALELLKAKARLSLRRTIPAA